MYKFVITALVVMFCVSMSTAQNVQSLVPESMTAAELWNPFSWYYPFGIAAANAWSDYLKNAQQATNQLYQQIQAVSNPIQNAAGKLTSAAPSVTTPQSSSAGTTSTTIKPQESTSSDKDSSTE